MHTHSYKGSLTRSYQLSARTGRESEGEGEGSRDAGSFDLSHRVFARFPRRAIEQEARISSLYILIKVYKLLALRAEITRLRLRSRG